MLQYLPPADSFHAGQFAQSELVTQMVGQEVLIQIDIEVQKLSLGKCQCLSWLFRTRSSFYFDFRLFLAGIGSHWHRLLVGGSLGRVLLVLLSSWLLVLLSSWLLV